MAEKYISQDLSLKPKVKPPEDSQARLAWFNDQIIIYIEKYGIFKLPSREESKEISKDPKRSYHKEEIEKLILGISQESGVDINEIKKYISENQIDLQRIALGILRQERKRKMVQKYSVPDEVPEEPGHVKNENLEIKKKKKSSYTEEELKAADFFGIGGKRAKFRTGLDDPGQNE